MNRAEFFEVLLRKLARLPQEEIQNALVYYTEYFDDAGVENEQRVIEELGDPAVIAQQILADYAEKNPTIKMPEQEKSRSVWWIVLAIFAAPILLPIFITLAVTLFVLAISLAAIIFSLWLVTFILCVVGIGVFLLGFSLIPVSALGAIFVIGSGMIVAALGILFGLLMSLLSGLAIKASGNLWRWITRRKKGGVVYE